MVDLAPLPVIEAQRLRLRAPARRDAARLAELAGDFDVARMTARLPHPYGPAEAEAFLTRCEGHDPAREQVFALETADDGLVGVVGLHPEADGRTELGYWIGKPFWGRGLATEAAKAALRYAAEAWGRRVVVASHFADNPASGRVLCKAGFLYTGVVRIQESLARRAPARSRMMVWLA